MAGRLSKAASLIESATPKSSVQSLSRNSAALPRGHGSQIRTLKTQPKKQAMADATLAADPSLMPQFMTPAAPRKEYKYLRNLVGRLPYVFEPPAKPTTEEFRFPFGTLFKAPNREQGLRMKDVYATALREHGVAGIELGFEDPDSKFMVDLVETMGCTPDSHSGDQGPLWDVKFKPEGVKNLAKGGTAHSRSHGLGEFQWHTDGSYEEEPQRYFGFHIIHPDKQGGGVFRVLKSEELVNMLSSKSVEKLMGFEFDIKVPDEFYKGKESNKGTLLEMDSKTGVPLLRFRRDILYDPPSNDPEANAAVEELAGLLEVTDGSNGVGKSVPQYAFKENMVLLVDNARFLHSRTDIKDPKRWIRRVRFNGDPGSLNHGKHYGMLPSNFVVPTPP